MSGCILYRNSSILIGFLLQLVLNSNTFVIGQITDQDSSLGYLEAHRLELAGWERGDAIGKYTESIEGRPYLIKEKRRVDNDSVVIIERTVYFRTIFDHSLSRYLFARRESSEGHLFSADGEELKLGEFPYIDESITAFVWDKKAGVGKVRIGKGSVGSLPSTVRPEDVLRKYNAFDLRCLGVITSFPPTQFPDVQPWLDVVATRDRLKSVEEVRKGIVRVMFEIPEEQQKDNARMVSFDLDADTYAPTRFSVQVAVNQIGLPLYRTVEEEKVDWVTKEGIQVPTKMIGFGGSSKEIMGRIFGLDVERRMDIHWNSVNESIEDKWFSPDFVLDAGKLISLLDPAGTTIEGVEKQSRSSPGAEEPKN